MRKLSSLFLILIMVVFFTMNSYAVSLDTIRIDADKTTIIPGSEVTLTINFGVELGAYTFDIAYDNNIFEFVSVDGGVANDTTDKIKVVFFDALTPRESMSVTFKAKDDITTSNPTEFTVVGEGMSNPDESIIYDDIVTPIVKNVVVEPEYNDYTINLTYTGEVIKGKEKDMKLTFSSIMGRYYEHARLIAEAITPTGATVKLMGINNEENAVQDLIQSGWGDPQGYEIGGKDFSQVLNLTALFSDEGEYTIHLKLIDRDDSDNVIAENKFSFTVLAQEDTSETTTTQINTTNTSTSTNTSTETPTTLPSTGLNVYVPIGIAILAIISLCVYYNIKNKE